MNRALVYFAVFAFCTAAWTALALAAIVAGLHLWRLAAALEPAWLVAVLLIGGGAMQLLIGLALHNARVGHIGAPRLYAISRSGRHVAAIGAVILAMGAGAVLAIEAGAL